MATTTRKSKAKTKTTKKTVSKAVRTAQKTSATSQVSATNQLMMLHKVGIVVSLALAAAAGFLMNRMSYQLFTGLLTRDELASKTTTVFVPAIHAVYDIELRWAVVTIMVLSAVVPILYLTRFKRRYQNDLKAKVNLLRWIDMAVVSALMVEVVAMLSGVQDIMTLKLLGGLIAITCMLGWLAEKQNADSNKPVWPTYIVSLVTGTLPWLMIAAYAAGTPFWGMVRSPWYVYALYGTMLLSFMGYVMNQTRQFKKQQDYVSTERSALQIGLFARVAFAVILIVGLYKK